MYPLSLMKANVGRLWEKLKNVLKNGWKIKFMAAALPDFLPLLDDGGSQRTGKCMYIKAWRTKRNFAGSTKTHCGRGRECPCFAVCALVCDLFPKGECVPAFGGEGKRGPFVREAEKRDEKWFGTALCR